MRKPIAFLYAFELAWKIRDVFLLSNKMENVVCDPTSKTMHCFCLGKVMHAGVLVLMLRVETTKIFIQRTSVFFEPKRKVLFQFFFWDWFHRFPFLFGKFFLRVYRDCITGVFPVKVHEKTPTVLT